MRRSLLLFAVGVALVVADDGAVHDAEAIAAVINADASASWTATGQTKFNGVPLARINKLMGAWASPDLPTPNMTYTPAMAIPAQFDARVKWPQCADVIGNIRDQSECGSCWAVAAASAMSDRICIASDGKTKVSISAANLMECCHMFTGGCGNGCEGGYPDKAWAYFARTGIVTGGGHAAKQGCQPYPFPSCEHHIAPVNHPACPKQMYSTPRCERKCQTGYKTPYNSDKHYGGNVVRIGRNVQQMQEEIMTNGPMEVAFTVYEDFLTYKSGVYEHKTGGVDGGHAVRVIGWGVESGVDYWLIANSWNADWGDKGYFKIRRGTNECGIEEDFVAAKMK